MMCYSPVGAVGDMINALTRTIMSLDKQPPDDIDKYNEIRTTLLTQSHKILELTAETKVKQKLAA